MTIRPEFINAAGVLSGAAAYALVDSRLDRRHRSVGVLTSEMHHADGCLLATAVGSFSIARRKPAG